MARASTPDIARALALRAWALRTLSSGPAPGSAAAPPEAAEPSDWRLFLTVERCAAALRERRDPDRSGLDSSILDVLDDLATRELQRILLARGELQRLASIAEGIGCRIVVLKGGVAIAKGGAVTLDDLDVLVHPEHARRLAGALDAAGHDVHINSSARHLDARVAPHSLPIEIHTTIRADGGPLSERVLDRAVPLDGLAGLWRLAPADHLWHVLEHSVRIHIERRGRLRDLLLIAAAAADCSADDLREVERRIASDALDEPLRRQLEMARAILEGAAPVDRFARLAATSYWAHTRLPVRWLPRWLAPSFGRWLFALSTGSADRRRLWTEAFTPGLDRSKYGFISAIERRAPPLGAACRIAFRVGRVPLAVALAAPAALAARRAVNRVLGRARS